MKIKESFFVFLLLIFAVTNSFSATEFEDKEIVFNPSFLSDDNNSTFFERIADNWDEKKHPFVAVSGALGFNLGLATWNRYMIGSGWAKTGWEEWNHFWERKMAWDRDWYWTNFFLHPYQGSMYYMASRGSNLNQLESLAVTFLGSYTWEYLCETNAPSKNDMVFTTIGSFCVGEMFYRLSEEAENVSRLLSIAINPQSLWTEYVWRVNPKRTSNNLYKLSLAVDAGNIVAGANVDGLSTSLYPVKEIYPAFGMIEFYTEYNDPYRNDSNNPYSQFSLYVQGGLGKGSGESGYCAYEDVDKKLFYDIRILSDGFLISREADFGENLDTSYGAVMIYDFEWHSYYLLSSLAPGFAFKQRYNREKDSFAWQAMAAYILLGNSDYFYFHREIIPEPDYVSCNYNNTIGGQTVLKFNYSTEKGYAAGIDFRGYAMYAFKNQLQENFSTGWDFIGLLTAYFEVPLSKIVRIGLKDEVYAKVTKYDDVNDVQQIVNTAKIFAKLQLK